jgi:hypothetical protein
MEFSRELREDVMSGDITVSFRLWRRPQVREGGQYRVGPVKIEVDSVELVPFASITAADIRRSGERDREALRRGLPMPARSPTTHCSTEWSFTSWSPSHAEHWPCVRDLHEHDSGRPL